MENELLRKLADKSLTKDELRQKVKQDFSLLPTLLSGVSSPKATVRYGCAKILMDLSAEYPDKLYPHMDAFVALLDSKYRILTWNAMAIIANLSRVDKENKFDAIFDKYYSFLNDEYLVTVANAVGNSGKIALAKPYLIPKITEKLLTVENVALTPHLTEECKRVIAEQAVETFDLFFDKVTQKAKVFAFVERQLNSSRKTLKLKAENFLKKWRQSSA
jgi:predicted house-cleaning noncanonical NTP pyrophosphatase (MazG superfamily)